MYKCKCGNDTDFKEVYRVETICFIEKGILNNSYDKKSDLMEVICLKCKESTEDEKIIQDGDILIIN